MSAFQSSILYSLILAVIGYVVMSYIDTAGIASQVIFTAGLLIGSVFVAIVSNVPTEETPPTTQASSNKLGPAKTIYVGNLPYRANEAAIKELFETFGDVRSIRLLKDRQTGKRRGFGFVEMDEAAADTAIKALNESEFQQRTLKVREAKDRPEKVDDDNLQEQV